MRILLDQGAPKPIKRYLPSHVVQTAFEMGWSTLFNGELLNQAELGGFELLITTDQNLEYQQNLSGRRISIVVLSTTGWPIIEAKIANIVQAVQRVKTGSYEVVKFDD